MIDESSVRDLMVRLLDWSDAHVDFDGAVTGVPIAARGALVEGFPHSLWQLLEHIRIAQGDILNFCLNPGYAELEWPRQYWPEEANPPEESSWGESIERVRSDREALKLIARDPAIELTAPIPHGSGQTYLRELVLVADHTSYHVGQIVALRRLLGIWGPD